MKRHTAVLIASLCLVVPIAGATTASAASKAPTSAAAVQKAELKAERVAERATQKAERVADRAERKAARGGATTDPAPVPPTDDVIMAQ